jgi:hypothetical protein
LEANWQAKIIKYELQNVLFAPRQTIVRIQTLSHIGLLFALCLQKSQSRQFPHDEISDEYLVSDSIHARSIGQAKGNTGGFLGALREGSRKH